MKRLVYSVVMLALLLWVEQVRPVVGNKPKGELNIATAVNNHPKITLESVAKRVDTLEEKFAKLSAEHTKLLQETGISAKVPAIPAPPTPVNLPEVLTKQTVEPKVGAPVVSAEEITVTTALPAPESELATAAALENATAMDALKTIEKGAQ